MWMGLIWYNMCNTQKSVQKKERLLYKEVQFSGVKSQDVLDIISRVFPILYYICLISRIKLESVKHDWRLVDIFLCLPLTVNTFKAWCNG